MAGGIRTRSTPGAGASASELGAELGLGAVEVNNARATIKAVLKSISLSQYYNVIVMRYGTLSRCRRLTHGDLWRAGVPIVGQRDRIIRAFTEVGAEAEGEREARQLIERGLAPAGMIVLRSLWLDEASCSTLTALPEGLAVGDTLSLAGCSALTSLPRSLSVGGHLDLEGCWALQERHRGDMGAFFEQLSAVLGPKAGLSLSGWGAVEQVPDGFSVGGNFVLGECLALTSLGDGLSVGGDLGLSDCRALTNLGDGLNVDGHLELYGCSALQEQHRGDMVAFLAQLSAVLGPKAGLSLAGWNAVEQVPEGFSVGGDLMMWGCLALASLGDGLSVGGDLNLRLCNALTSLPDSLSVGGDVNCQWCTALTSLGDDLSVSGHLDLFHCSVLASLPGSLSVGGVLTLTGCSLEDRYRSDMGAFFEQLSAVLGPNAGLCLAWWNAVELVPDGFTVGGHLDLSSCSFLTSLPDGLSVRGHLELGGCSALTGLPDGLSVGGSLSLKGCSALTSLPGSLSVGGHLDLGFCSALQERHRGDMGAFFEQLSAALGAEAGLSLAGWDAVELVPDSIAVGGDLNLQDCSALTSLGDGLSVGGDLDLRRCSALASLGNGLGVGGTLDLCGCSALTSLGDGLSVAGNFSLKGCSALTSLPASLIKVNGDLDLRDCTELATVPDGLFVNGSLSLACCTALTGLPKSLRVKGSLGLRQCTALEAQHVEDMEAFLLVLREIIGSSGGLGLGEWTTIRELPDCFADFGGELQLDLSGCTALTRLPEGMQVRGSLCLRGCTALRRLPDGLRVDGSLDLEDCTSLTSLPVGLWVSNGLDVTHCTSLTSLPEDLHVSGDLWLERCTSLESLPASILDWPADERGRPRDIYLGGSGLSVETLEWLREADAPGLRFHIDLRRGGQSEARPGFASAAEAAAFWSSEAQVEAVAVPTEADDATLVRFLSRLRDAKEFGIAETRKALAKRVVNVLELLAGDDEYVREELLLRMADSLDACGDKPVWALNQMHLVVEVAKARESAEQLQDLGRRVVRLMVVHEHAKRKVDSLAWVDDVCVYLRFEIDLREALDLPVAATAMIFPSYINVTDEDLESAKDDALAITDAQFEAWLAEWPEWQRHERHQVVAELRWQELAEIKRRQSLRKRASRRLSQLLNLSGDKMSDPVTLDDGKSVWSSSDLLRHWERTGLDLHNAPVSVEQLRSDLKRVVA